MERGTFRHLLLTLAVHRERPVPALESRPRSIKRIILLTLIFGALLVLVKWLDKKHHFPPVIHNDDVTIAQVE